jgi:hypothetical protein
MLQDSKKDQNQILTTYPLRTVNKNSNRRINLIFQKLDNLNLAIMTLKSHNLNKINQKGRRRSTLLTCSHSLTILATQSKCILTLLPNLHLLRRQEFHHLILKKWIKILGSQCLTFVVLSTHISSRWLMVMDSTERKWVLTWSRNCLNISKLRWGTCLKSILKN